MTRKVVFVKETMNAKAAGLFCDLYNFADTLDPQFLTALIWGGEQDFNPNICSNRRAFATEYEGSVQRNVVGEASLRVLPTIVPMEDNRESELVSNSGSTLQPCLSYEKEIHTWAQIRVFINVLQVSDRLKIQKSEVGIE